MRRFWLWTAIALLILLIMAAVVYIFRDRLIAPQVKRLIIQEIESELGVTVAIDRVGGTFLTSLELSGVRTVQVRHGSIVTGLAIHHGRARYWLPDVLGGFYRLLGNAEIVLEGAGLVIDLDRAPSEERELPIGFPSPAAFPDLSIINSRLTLQREGVLLELDGMDADLQAPGITETGSLRLDLRSGTATIDHPWIAKQSAPLAARLGYDEEQLVFEELRFGGRPLIREASLDVSRQRQEHLILSSNLLAFGGEIELEGELRGPELAVRLGTEGISLERLSGFLAPVFPDSTGELEISLDFQVNREHPENTLTGTLDLQLLEGSFRNIPADRIIMQATAEQGDILIRRFQGRVGENTMLIDGIGFPAAALLERQWSRLLEASPGTFSLRLNDIPALLEIAGRNELVRETAIPPHQLVLQGRIGGRVLLVTEGFLKTRTGRVEVDQARLELPPMKPWQEAPVRAAMTFDVPRLAELGAVLGLSGLNGALTGEIDVEGTLGEPKGRATASGRQVAYRNVPLGNWQLRALAEQKVLRVQRMTLEHNGDRIDGQGVIRLEAGTIDRMEIDFRFEDMGHYAPLLPAAPELAGNISGKLTGTGPFADPALRLEANARQARVAGLEVRNARAALASQGRTVTIEQAEAATPHATVNFSGEVLRGPGNHSFEARLASMTLTTPDGGEMRLVRPATLGFNLDGDFAARDVLLRGNAGEIHLDGRLGPRPDSELTVKLSGVTSRYWLPLITDREFAFEGLDAVIILRGSLRGPYIRTSGTLEDLRLEKVPFPIRGSFDFDLGPEGLNFREFSWRGKDEFGLFLTGTLPLDPWREEMFLPGPLSLSGTFEIPSLEAVAALFYPDLELQGELAGDIRLTGTWRSPTGHLQLSGSRVLARHLDRPAPIQPVDLAADLLVQDSRFRLQNLRISSRELEFTAGGIWTGGPPLGDLLRGRDPELTGTVDLRGMLAVPDIAWLARGIEPVRRLGGALQAELAVTGMARDPEIKGFLRLDQGELRTTWDIPPIEPLAIEAELAGRRIILRRVEGEMGGAPFTLTGEIVREPETGPVLALNLKGRNLLLFRDEWTLLRADSDITIKGPWQQPAVGGELALTDGYYRKNVAYFDILRGTDRPRPQEGLQLFSFRQEPLRSMTFDVRIKPKNPFRIDNNLVSGTLRPDLTLIGTGELPVLVGPVYADEIRVRLPTTRLEVESGLILFTEARPNRPSLDLLAHARMIGYDINVQIEGTVAEPVVILSSVPPLPQDDLLLLLIAGRLPENGMGRELTRAGGFNIAMYVGRGLLADWLLRDELTEDSLLERLQIEVGRGITRQGRETLDARLAIAEDVLSRDDALYITAERDVYDDFNVGIKIVFRFR